MSKEKGGEERDPTADTSPTSLPPQAPVRTQLHVPVSQVVHDGQAAARPPSPRPGRQALHSHGAKAITIIDTTIITFNSRLTKY
ncbi:hypothetical protein E2C01_101754 [Portunus trituberculatus]|uniref:Uncharacterized protein n=1 Tax=Portunus trituberculatus TaxID=210409 RepID=A0A5B7KL51_PORTR|nr:hypothetical protein [Portunus trituberculatus]